MIELTARFLEDRRSLSAAELDALTRHLESHPEELAEMRAQLACDDLLSRRFDEKRAAFVARVKDVAAVAPSVALAEGDFVRAVQRRVGLEKEPSAFARWRRWWAARPRIVWAAAVRAACVLAAMIFLRPAAPPKLPDVRLAETRGDVRVWRDQQTMAATSGFALRAGDWVLTGDNGSAAVEFPGETTRIVLGAKAEFGVVTARPGKQLKLVAGTLTASVARQSASQPMLLRTPTARAEVLGTKFELSANKTATQLRVTEGRVLIAQKDEESGVVVESAQTATVTDSPTVQIAVQPIPKQLSAGLLAQWTFDGDGADASGNGRNLKMSAGAAFSDGRLGKALDLHAAKVDVESPRIALPPVFTVAMWLRLNPGEARVQPLIGCDGQQAGADDFWLLLPPNFPGSGIMLDVRGRQMGSLALARRGVVFAGRWHHIAVVADSVQGRAAFYADGRDVTEQGGLRRDFKLAGPLLIGRRVKGGPLPFDGQLDDIRIYGRALSTSEISALAAGNAEEKQTR